MYNFLYITSYLSILLLIGIALKSKIKFFQNLFIPASVIGGVVGLFLGEQFLGRWYILIPIEWEKILKNIPGILIIPILISLPLGITLKKERDIMKNSLKIGAILFFITVIQLFFGYSMAVIFEKVFNLQLYTSFGSELNAGFAGGHGTAALVGTTFEKLSSNYWNVAQGITATFATIGLIGGIVIGIYSIKKRNKELGYNAILEYKNGFIKNKKKQGSIGRETMVSTTVDTLGYHLAIIFGVSGVSILSFNFLKKIGIPLFSKITVWSYGMLLMFVIWKIIEMKKLDWSIDTKVKGKISSTLTEYMIVATMATLPLKAVAKYMLPILLISILGLTVTWILIKKIAERYFDDHQFERTIAMFGTSTGVFITGILLLKICDSKLETSVFEEYSFGFSIVALLGPFLIVMCIEISYCYNYIYLLSILLILGIVTIFMLEILKND